MKKVALITGGGSGIGRETAILFAASGYRTIVADCPEEEWHRIVDTDLKGVWLCLKYQCHYFSRSGHGAIVNTSSTMGLVSKPGLSCYSAAKAGLIGLTRAVALEYADRGVRVNSICPGVVATPLTRAPAMRERIRAVEDATPMGRMAAPREIAETVLWLCSDAASYMTGQAIAIDGGYTAL